MSFERVYPYLVLLFVVILLGLAGHEDYKAACDADRDASASEIQFAAVAR